MFISTIESIEANSKLLDRHAQRCGWHGSALTHSFAAGMVLPRLANGRVWSARLARQSAGGCNEGFVCGLQKNLEDMSRLDYEKTELQLILFGDSVLVV